ncbi:MAG: SDR family oxidoreductase [Candidatus Levybacteria bacterium]|nr:SDR family oxidoreductase [Candidatus Levybacteria bacterium]
MKESNKILIIGGCGYIGSALFLYLKNLGYTVDTVDLEWYGNYSNPQNIKKDYIKLKKDFLNQYNVVILLAGYSSVAMCANMKKAFKNNVFNFINLLNNLKDQKFIYASSSTVYGSLNVMYATEEYDRYLPTNYYDLSKKEIDYYTQLSDVNYFGLRLGTVNGYSPNLRTDLMINKMYSVIKKEKKLKIFNPTLKRPILGIGDACRAFEYIIKKDRKKGIYNIASFNASVEEIGVDVAKAMNVKMEIVKGALPLYDFTISSDKFIEEFGFKFNDTTRTIVESLRNNKLKGASTREK